MLRRSQDLQTGKHPCSGESETSSNGSYTSSDDSDVANWEEFVTEDGALFYIEYIRECKINGTEGGGEGAVEFKRGLQFRSGKKNGRRQPMSLKEDTRNPAKSDILFSNIDTNEESCKTLELVITASDRYRFGRRSTAIESILGFNVVPFVDQPECLMVDGFVHDMPALFQQGQQKPIARGDWFKSLDHIEIRTSNIDELLLQFVEPTKVCLKFQGPLESQGPGNANENGGNGLCKIENYTQFSQEFAKLQKSTDNAMVFGFLILPPECYQNDEHKSSLYHYPENPENFLYKARGSFLTLNAVLSEELKTKPFASELTVDGEDFLVLYRNMNGFLVLFSYLSSMVTMPEGNLLADELLTYLSFMYPRMNLESFKNASFRQSMENFCNIQRTRLLSLKQQKGGEYCLEESLKESRHLPLPKEAQLRIFDALSEMEAMDYRNWNDEPLHTHREFFIYGSTLYYNNLMLTSQMPLDMRQHIEVFLRCHGVFEFTSKHNTKELYIWEEIKLPEYIGRYFLAVCGRGHLILSVILKLFCSPDITTEPKILPSLFYIEEIQETLDHLIHCGIESLAMFWSVSNKRPEVHLDWLDCGNAESTKESKAKDILSGKQKSTPTKDISGHCEDDAQLCSSAGGSSIHSLTPSEDDGSKKRLLVHLDDSDSGSDWEHFMEENMLPSGVDAELQSQVTESLWKEISNVVPIKLSSGNTNRIFYFVYVDGGNSTSFSPMRAAREHLPFARQMHLAFHRIRKVLQPTKHYRRESLKPSNSRGDIIPIKEHGMTIEVRKGDSTSSDSKKYSFVVVGRLFLSPPREVYICHSPDMSANMVEMAFRLSFSSSG